MAKVESFDPEHMTEPFLYFRWRTVIRYPLAWSIDRHFYGLLGRLCGLGGADAESPIGIWEAWALDMGIEP